MVYAPGVSQGTDSGMSESYATLEAPLVVSVATGMEIALPVSPKRSSLPSRFGPPTPR